MRELPRDPAIDLGGGAPRGRQQRRAVGQVADDRRRFPQDQVAVLEHRHATVGISGQERRSALVAGEQIDPLVGEWNAELVGDGADLAAVGREWKVVELHGHLLRSGRPTAPKLFAVRAEISYRGLDQVCAADADGLERGAGIVPVGR
jgi:hypothetical protein